ncbi:hypothetical protein [Kineococcus arenarius]|uniref:hypothetical protein n=1 Tax=Kineococcus sp. SYSU DK007 TaxID=3383128 RepID=UPI003D7F0035
MNRPAPTDVPLRLAAGPADGWIPLPLDPGVDAHAWALDVLVLLAHELPAHERQALDAERVAASAGHLARVAALAREDCDPDADLAFALVLRPDHPVLAWADIAAGTDPRFVEAVDAAFAGEDARWTVHSERTEVELPAGPAVRLRSVVAPLDPPPGAAPHGEGVDHLVRLRGGGRAVLRSRWTRLAAGDELAAAVDALAATVAVEPLEPAAP